MDDYDDEISPIATIVMTRKFIPDALEIERQSFTVSWTDEHFAEAIKLKNCNGIVATIREIVCGFAIYEIDKDRIAIVNFAVGRDWRRSGVGRELFSKIITRAKQTSREKIYVALSEYHTDGQFFLKSMGCKCVQKVAAVADKTNEDCYLFEMDLTTNSQAS